MGLAAFSRQSQWVSLKIMLKRNIFIEVFVQYVCMLHDFQPAFPEQRFQWLQLLMLQSFPFLFIWKWWALATAQAPSSPLWHHRFYCTRNTLCFEGFISKSSELWESTWAYAGMIWIQLILLNRPLHQGRFACVAGSSLSSFELRWGDRLGKHEWGRMSHIII